MKKYILFISCLMLVKCPPWHGSETNLFFVALQIHICYYLSGSRLPLKVTEDRCSLLYKRSNKINKIKHRFMWTLLNRNAFPFRKNISAYMEIIDIVGKFSYEIKSFFGKKLQVSLFLFEVCLIYLIYSSLSLIFIGSQVHKFHKFKTLVQNSKKIRKSHAQSCNDTQTAKKKLCNLIKFYSLLMSKTFPLQTLISQPLTKNCVEIIG